LSAGEAVVTFASPTTTAPKEMDMQDLLMVALIVLFFAASLGYVKAFDQL